MQYRYYSLACHQGTSTQEIVIDVLALSLRDAVEAVLKWGYTLAAPPGYELVQAGHVLTAPEQRVMQEALRGSVEIVAKGKRE